MTKRDRSLEPSLFVNRMIGGFGNKRCEFSVNLCRWSVAICQAITILLTWRLWQVREFPPLLPMDWFPSVSGDVGTLLLLSLGLVVLFPKWGAMVHAMLVAISMAMDQTRIQPQIVSCAILMLATIPARTQNINRRARRELEKSGVNSTNGWLLMGRVHLVTLLFYSGFHKLISPGYYQPVGVVHHLLEGLLSDQHLAVVKGIVALTEIAIAVLMCLPRFRKPACIVAALLHLGILIGLIYARWNTSVWSWNVAILVSDFVFFWWWTDKPRETAMATPALVRLIALAMFIMPMGYYIELTDAYLAHCLYSRNKTMAFTFRPLRGERATPRLLGVNEYIEALNVALPNEHRLFEASFARSNRTQPGDLLHIHDPRLGSRLRGRRDRWFRMNKNRDVVVIQRPTAETKSP